MITVYLDLNKYIELSQLYHHKTEDISGILEFIVSKKNESLMIFPISVSLVIEFAKHSDIDRRKRLAETMLFFSNGQILLNRTELLNYEIDCAIETILNLKHKDKPTNLFGTNIIRGFAPVTNTIFDEFFDKELWLDIVSSNNDDDRLKALHPIIDAAKRISNSVNKNRKILEKETSYTYFKSLICLMFLDTQEKVLARLMNFNLEKELIQKLWKENAMAIYQNIPSLNIEVQLKYHAFKNKQKTTVENDIFDWGALSSAINYYNVVITENFWTNIAKQAKLELKYDTIIKNDLKGLFDIII